MTTWEPLALALGTMIVGIMLGIALGYYGGKIEGMVKMAEHLIDQDAVRPMEAISALRSCGLEDVVAGELIREAVNSKRRRAHD